MTIDVNSKNILTSTGIYWNSNGFNAAFDSLIFTEIKVRRKLYPKLYFSKLTRE